MTAVVADASTNTSVVRIGVVGVRSKSAGVRREGQPVWCRRPAAVIERPANTPARRMGAGVIAGSGGPESAGS